jgi:hypothetical protein
MAKIQLKTFEILDELGISQDEVNNLTPEQYSNLARIIINDLEAKLPAQISFPASTSASKLNFKALTLREVLAHRVHELASVAIELYDRDLAIPAFIMSRAVLETVCLLYSFYQSVQRFKLDQDKLKFDEFLSKALAGSRNKSTPYEALNILSSIDKADKEFDGLKRMYDSLCEFTHPNWSGVLGAYGKIDDGSQCVNFEVEFRSKKNGQGFAPFIMSLFVFADYYNGLGEEFEQMVGFQTLKSTG